MKIKFITLLFCLTTILISCKNEEKNNYPEGLFAEIKTSKGTIVVQLEYTKTPLTVANFVSLAEGNNNFVSEIYKEKPFYNGLKFHRVMSNFMIQGGDPDGTGSGGTGYTFKDEITDLKFDEGGVLAMANSGPSTNSSQFFITHVTTPWLDGKHTIFGHVIDKGMEVVNKIIQDDVIESIKIIRNGNAAKQFDAVKTFSAEMQKFNTLKSDKVSSFNQIKTTATKCDSGLQYAITQKGSGVKLPEGSTVYIQYAGFLENGTLFDSSIKSLEESYGKYNQQKDMHGGYKPFPFKIGQKDGLIDGFIEGLEKMNVGDKATIFIPSHLGYKEQGAGNVIPPNANIIFEIEMLATLPK